QNPFLLCQSCKKKEFNYYEKDITEREFTFLSTMDLGEIGTEENEILNSYDNKSDNVIHLDTNIDWVKMKI
ncbi:12100_t:CDS:1, partial [Entrophospora sp. SA101]